MAIKKRFTFFTDDYPAVTCDSCYEDQNEYYTGPAIDRLAEYEGTGLMPAEVAALKQELKYAKQKCREERRWIPVTERLPERTMPPHDVLVYHDLNCGMFIDRAWYSHEKNKWRSAVGMNLKVTHWMPLPEPPKEGAEG